MPVEEGVLLRAYIFTLALRRNGPSKLEHESIRAKKTEKSSAATADSACASCQRMNPAKPNAKAI
jgi:hypothetical protein